MSDCPCCSNTLLRQLRSHQVVWFCRHCWQEMPNVGEMTRAQTGVARHSRPASLSTVSPQFAALSSIQHHPLAATYLTPSMPAALTILPSPVAPHPALAMA